jgi:hypothetical protein
VFLQGLAEGYLDLKEPAANFERDNQQSQKTVLQ